MIRLIIAAMILTTLSVFGQKKQTGNPSVDSLNNEKDTVFLAHKLKKLEGGNEQDLIILMNYYIYNSGKREAMANIARRRFPKGALAFNDAQQNLYKEEDVEKQELLFKKLCKDFPARNFDQAYHTMAIAHAKVKNLPKVTSYLSKIKNVSSKGMAVMMVVQEIMNYDPQAAEKLLRPEIERLMEAGVPDDPRANGTYYGFLNVFGAILIKNDKYDQALPYIKQAYDHTTRRDDQLSGNYGLVLSKNNRHPEALPLLQKLVDEAKADVKIKEAFEESYSKLNPGKSAAVYLGNVSRALKLKMESEVDKILINEPSPDFTVKDINGKTVSLADFKGKTIVLDFWATWCGPCKKSFPSMQSVLNMYKKDPDVKFLFIHTRETVADPLSDAKNYLSANNYEFDLYMDIKDPLTKQNNAVTAFGAKGIPAKFVIDGEGNIRFRIIGFSGGDDAAIAELSYMIELAKR